MGETHNLVGLTRIRLCYRRSSSVWSGYQILFRGDGEKEGPENWDAVI